MTDGTDGRGSEKHNDAIGEFGHWYDELYRIAARHLRFHRSRADVESVVQDVLVKAWEIWESFADEKHLKKWLIAAVRNRHIDYLRKLSKERPMSDSDNDALARLPHVDGVPEISYQLWEALQRLEEIERTVFLMAEYEGHTLDQIADSLGLSTRTVSRNRGAAKRKLKRWLGRAASGPSTSRPTPDPPTSADDGDDDRDGEGAR